MRDRGSRERGREKSRERGNRAGEEKIRDRQRERREWIKIAEQQSERSRDDNIIYGVGIK